MKNQKKQVKLNLLKSKVLHDFVLLRPVVVEEVRGLIKKPQQYDDKPEYGEVISIGDRVKSIKKGDCVLFQKYSSEKVRDSETGVDYMIVKEEDIRCIL
jgi:co-chaperonin GroES (HSP10)